MLSRTRREDKRNGDDHTGLQSHSANYGTHSSRHTQTLFLGSHLHCRGGTGPRALGAEGTASHPKSCGDEGEQDFDRKCALILCCRSWIRQIVEHVLLPPPGQSLLCRLEAHTSRRSLDLWPENKEQGPPEATHGLDLKPSRSSRSFRVQRPPSFTGHLSTFLTHPFHFTYQQPVEMLIKVKVS